VIASDLVAALHLDAVVDAQAMPFANGSIKALSPELLPPLSMNVPGRYIAVTGATGYIGRALVRQALAFGWQVRALSRRFTGIEHIPYDLAVDLPAAALAGVGAVIHLAADTGSAPDPRRERRAARSLLGSAVANGVRVVFVSSQAARPEAPSAYGLGKWLVEQDVLDSGGVVARAGLVYGCDESGLFGMLCRLVRLFPILPDLRPNPLVQPIHVDDLAAALLRLATPELPPGLYCLADPETITFTDFLRGVASARIRRARLFVPFPIWTLITLLAIGHRFGLAGDPERLRSLATLTRMTTKPDIERLGLVIRPLHSGLSRPGECRRRLLSEADVLLRYVLRRAPPRALLARYVRGVEALHAARPLLVPRWLRTWPGGLVLLDIPALARASGLGPRLDLATRLAESTPLTAGRFLSLSGGRFGAASGLLIAGVAEAVFRSLRLPLMPWIRRQHSRLAAEP
jgi:uncharacterized protein YbjT (DUF2867 family)